MEAIKMSNESMTEASSSIKTKWLKDQISSRPFKNEKYSLWLKAMIITRF